jgi:ribosomal protein S18 acetylase RimI-like enzyme
MTQIGIKRCRPGDELALSLVGQATFLETFAGLLGGNDIIEHCQNQHSVENYRQWLNDTRYALWLAQLSPGEAPVGFLVVSPPDLPLNDTSKDLELKRIYLLSKFQGGGLGKRLIRTAVEHATDAGAERLLLGVYAGNENAIGFYRHIGFEQLGTRKFNVGGMSYDDNILGKRLDTEQNP